MDLATPNGNRKAPRTGMSNEVLKYLQNRRNIEVYVMDVAADLRANKHQIQNAMHFLKKSCDLISPRANWWIYRGPLEGEEQSAVVEIDADAKVRAILEDNKLLIVCEGKLYIATPLEV